MDTEQAKFIAFCIGFLCLAMIIAKIIGSRKRPQTKEEKKAAEEKVRIGFKTQPGAPVVQSQPPPIAVVTPTPPMIKPEKPAPTQNPYIWE